MRVIMSRQDTAKARIKKLESDMLGLTYRLGQMRMSQAPSSDSANTSINATFNARTKRDALYSLFRNASQVQSVLTRQILAIRDELASLHAAPSYDYDFRLTA